MLTFLKNGITWVFTCVCGHLWLASSLCPSWSDLVNHWLEPCVWLTTFSSLTCGEYLHLFHFGKILWIKQTGLHRPLLSPLIGKSYQWLLEWMTDGTKPVFNMLRNCWVYFPRKLMMAGIVVVLCTMSMQKHSSHFKGGNGWFILEPVWGTHIWFFQNIVSHHGRGYMRFY